MIDHSTAVKASWRKKTVKISDFKSKYQHQRYILDTGANEVTYAVVCVMNSDGTFPANTYPCSTNEIARLEKEYKRRNNIVDDEDADN